MPPNPTAPSAPQEARRAVGGGVKVQFVSVHKESHVLEVPEVSRGCSSY